jgi:hypothetical protein
MNRQDETHFDKAYRYVSFNGLWRTIENKSLRFTSVSELNDPLDNSIYLLPLPSPGWKIINNDPVQHEAVKKLYNRIASSFYLCCFSKTYKNLNSYLMWAYYSNNHQGVCFEVDFKKYKLLGGPLFVHYSDSLVKLRNKFVQPQKGFGPVFLTHKSSVWKHEQEVRLIIMHNEDNQKEERYTISGDLKHTFLPINLSIISKIIFGIKASEEDKLKTAMMFIERGLKPTFEELFINPSNLKLEARKYTVHLNKVYKTI